MKIIELRRKAIINFFAMAGFFIALIVVLYYNIEQKSDVQNQIDKIKVKISEIKAQTLDLQSKTTEAKRYKALWLKMSDDKKNTKGIKMDEINSKLAAIAKKYNIIEPVIKVSIPETLDGQFQRETIDIVLANVGMAFNAIDDANALAFISEFISSIPGYSVITALEIKKEKNYSNDDLVAISFGKGKGVVFGKVDFFWYAYKAKITDIKKNDDANSDIVPSSVPQKPENMSE